MSSIFTRIIQRQAPARVFYETDEVIVIADRYPRDTVHLLIIPKEEYPTFYETPPEVLRMLEETAKLVAKKLDLTDHFRLVINNGYGQEIFHIHYHFLSNRHTDKLKFMDR